MPSCPKLVRLPFRKPQLAPLLAPALLAPALLLAACGGSPDVERAAAPTSSGVEERTAVEPLPPPPALPGAMTPNWAVGTAEPMLSWLEPVPEADRPASRSSTTMRLRVSRLTNGGWSEPVTVTAGEDLFANWADFPAVAAALPGSGGEPAPLFAHWLAKTGDATYAYAVQLARSRDGGATWDALGSLHPDDPSPTEHGFVSFVPEPDGVRAFWLDGRRMASGGPMTLRTALLRGEAEEAVGPGRQLDDRVCECCQTGAARTRRGTVVAYRDRSETEVRDIYFVRAGGSDTEATEPGRPVAEDGWNLPGCPVNGPAVAATGELTAVAWFTGAGGEEGRSRPRVQAAFSTAHGFGEPILIDGARPLGRVGIAAAADGGVVVSWLALAPAAEPGEASEKGTAELRLVHVSPDGRLGTPLTIARTRTARAGGFPRLIRSGDFVYLAWRNLGGDPETSRLEVRRLPIEAVPSAE